MFIQIGEYRIDDLDRYRALADEWERATAGKRTARRAIVARDRNDPQRILDIVFFDSYESAMENSRLPETDAAAQQLRELCAGEPVHDLEVIEERSW